MLTVKQGDTHDLRLTVRSEQSGQPVDLTGAAVALFARTATGASFELPADIENAEAGRIVHRLSGDLAPGTYYLVVKVTRDGVQATAPSEGTACLKVEPNLEVSAP